MKICLFVYEVFLIVLDVQKNKFLLELLFLIQLRFQFETQLILHLIHTCLDFKWVPNELYVWSSLTCFFIREWVTEIHKYPQCLLDIAVECLYYFLCVLWCALRWNYFLKLMSFCLIYSVLSIKWG